MSIVTIALPGLEVFGRPIDGTRPDGVYLGPDGFEGWDDGPEMRRETLQRAQAAGDFEAKGYPDARIVSLSGIAISGSEERTRYWGTRVTGVLNSGGMGAITVRRGNSWQFGRAGLVRSSFVTRPRARHVADWQMQLWLPNPFKYGEERQMTADSQGFASVQHWGNAEASPRLVVRGNAERWRVTGKDGSSVLVVRPLRPGETHAYDLRTGVLTIDGAPAPAGSLDEADTWVVPPARAIGHQLYVGTGTGTLDVFTRDTYL